MKSFYDFTADSLQDREISMDTCKGNTRKIT
jgi:hypothetical protein